MDDVHEYLWISSEQGGRVRRGGVELLLMISARLSLLRAGNRTCFADPKLPEAPTKPQKN